MEQISEYVIVSDFDGTITIEDSTVELVNNCGNAENDRIEVDFIAGTLSNRDAMAQHFEALKISLADFTDFIKANINIDPTFDTFLMETGRLGVSLNIVSAGYCQTVETVLGDKRLQGVDIYANVLAGEPYVKSISATAEPACDKAFGPCGNCKRDCMRAIRHKSGKKLIFIGDGLTDRCAASEADLFFAKDALARYCNEQNLPYIPYKNFNDILNYLGLSNS
ncbi:MAG: MtnX-like HAD-IB family phosphatase [Oscillospiraceae bacterium]|nr:MtnX-like HAD-IB family phosphatase [Oscillospiraceae bacterium]MCL2279738.1 MtnX-like HAD-IB family phosphatase [Oscillospiraceae bacterium]